MLVGVWKCVVTLVKIHAQDHPTMLCILKIIILLPTPKVVVWTKCVDMYTYRRQMCKHVYV